MIKIIKDKIMKNYLKNLFNEVPPPSPVPDIPPMPSPLPNPNPDPDPSPVPPNPAPQPGKDEPGKPIYCCV